VAALGLAACHGASPHGDGAERGLTAAAAANTGTEDATAQARAAAGDLPLERGVYVSLNTACDAASDATVSVLGPSAISRDGRTCEFVGVNRGVSATTYTVIVHCVSTAPADSRDDVETWELTSPRSFSRRGASGWHEPARLCPRSELPPRWRSTDLGG